jgi:hypothetical protein
MSGGFIKPITGRFKAGLDTIKQCLPLQDGSPRGASRLWPLNVHILSAVNLHPSKQNGSAICYCKV